MDFIQISLPDTGEAEWEATRECFETGWLTSGPKVRAFEAEFAKRHQVSNGIATTSCTTALHLALAALDIGPGDEVIVPAFTWVATANVVLYCGAEVVFVDIEKGTFNIDPEKIAEKITSRTKAIIAVHLFGLCADIDAIREVAPSIPIIEDAACASGASYKGSPAGSLGVAGCFSFHPRKPITTGEGGMVTTNDTVLAERMEVLRNHGASISEEQRHSGSQPYLLPDFNILGFNYRMTDIQAAVGLVQLGKLDRFIEERESSAQFYHEKLSQINWLNLPTSELLRLNGNDSKAGGENVAFKHSWQAFVTSVDPDEAPFPRNEIMERLQAAGVATRPGTHAVHMLGYYADRYDLKPEDFPNARFANDHSMAIPLHNRMTSADYEKVAEIIIQLA